MGKRRLILITFGAVPAIVVAAVLGVAVHWVAGLVAGVVVAFVIVGWLVRASSAPLGVMRTSRLSADEAPRVHNVLEGVCASHGFAFPDVTVAETEAVNAALFGPANDAPSLVVTRGLLERCDLLGLEAAVAHLLVRTRDSDLGAASLYPAVARLVPVAGLRERLRVWAVGDRPRLRADLASVRITRYPPGLVSVLEAVSGADTTIPGAVGAADHLWLLPAVPTGARGLGSDAGVDERIAILREL